MKILLKFGSFEKFCLRINQKQDNLSYI